ncbi:FAD-dependent oxidoreductase [Candidatus Micrarchaeota archaeon]|nr:FAD-dependent oxidoreductase [Candidatus Micrarchaeota archaeon]
MKQEYEAIVIGGGIAGLTSAAYLCKNGIRPLLVEKSEKTGGLVNAFRHKGFAFDAGIRAFENSGILFPMLKNLGIDIQFESDPVSIGICDQWKKLSSNESLQDYSSMLKTIFPNNTTDISRIMDEIKKVIGYMDVLYGIDNPLFMENLRDREYLTKTLLPWMIKYKFNVRKAERLNEPINDHLELFTKNKALIDIISQHFFKDTPAFFALSYFGLYRDYAYPLGGTGVLAEKLTEYITGSGGQILTSVCANEIDPKKHEILLSEDEKLSYKKLIWAADQKTLYSAIKNFDSPDFKKQHLLVEGNTGGDSILTLFMGIDLSKDYFHDRCGAHSFYTPSSGGISSLPDFRDAAKRGTDFLLEWVGNYLEKTTYEISCPVLRDASLAPEGKTGLIVSTLMDYDIVRIFYDSDQYGGFKQYCSEKIKDILSKSVFHDIKEKMLFSLCATPLTIERETGNYKGAITGWAFTKKTIPAENHFRKITRSIRTPIPDVMQCGQWTFSPSGLPISVLTGKLAADGVCKTLKG